MGALPAIAIGLFSGALLAVFGLRLPFAWVGCVAVLGLGGLLAASTQRAGTRPARRAWIPFALAAALAGQALAPHPPPSLEVPRGVARVDGRVLRAPGDGVFLEIDHGTSLTGSAPLPPGARIFVRGADAPPGASVRVLARLSPRHVFENPTPHPRWPSPHLSASGPARSRAVLTREAPFWSRTAHGARQELRRVLRATLSPEAAGLAQALVLGETRAVDRDARDAVRGSGLSHVLAVSGLHVTLLAGSCVMLFTALLLRVERLALYCDVRRIARALGIPIALGYALLVSNAPSAWRAAVTASLAWALFAAGRRAHPLAVTASAVLVLGITRPDDLARPGFALSVLATAAIVSDHGPVASNLSARLAGVLPFLESADDDTAEASRDTSPWRSGLTLAWRTMIATAPIVLWIFGDLPLVGLLANVVMVPVAGAVLLPLVAVHALLASISVDLAALSAPLLEGATSAFFAASEVFAEIEVGRGLPPPSVAQGVVFTALCVGWLALRSGRSRAALLALTLLGLLGAELHLRHTERPEGEVRITFLDVGQGDAALVDLPDGRLMVIDAGGAVAGGPDPGADALVPLLRARRRERVDVFVLSHPHPDHYGGLAAILDAVEVGEIWDSGQAQAEDPEGLIATTLERARHAGVPIRGPSDLCRSPHHFGDATIRVLWPCPEFDPGWGENENSLVLELVYGSRRFLFTGDAEAHAEAALTELALGPVDVLKVAHHGSRTSSASALLDILRPRVAVVSAGRQNRFGHPHPDVWARVVAAAGCAFRTNEHGGVIVRTDGRTLEATPTLGTPSCRAP